MLFDLCSEVNVAAVLCEHGGMCIAKSPLVCAGRNMNDIYIGLDLLSDRDAVFNVISFRYKLGAAHTELKREEGTDCLSHSLQDLHCEAAAVLDGSAILIRAMVEHRGEELVDEPAMSSVDH